MGVGNTIVAWATRITLLHHCLVNHSCLNQFVTVYGMITSLLLFHGFQNHALTRMITAIIVISTTVKPALAITWIRQSPRSLIQPHPVGPKQPQCIYYDLLWNAT